MRFVIYNFLKHERHRLLCLSVRKCAGIMEDLPIKEITCDRLSNLVFPTHYDINLQPNMVTGIFKGNVAIAIQAKESFHHLNIHSKYLNIDSVKMFKKMHEIPILNYIEIADLEQLNIQFPNKLDLGEYVLEIEFNGDLTRNIVGFYLSRLRNNRYF